MQPTNASPPPPRCCGSMQARSRVPGPAHQVLQPCRGCTAACTARLCCATDQQMPGSMNRCAALNGCVCVWVSMQNEHTAAANPFATGRTDSFVVWPSKSDVSAKPTKELRGGCSSQHPKRNRRQLQPAQNRAPAMACTYVRE